jgi:hypothetical protein
MATHRQKITAERKLRELLESAQLPLPDEVEYGHTCIRAIWWEQKRAVVIDLDDLTGSGNDSEEADLDESLDLDEVVDLTEEGFEGRYPWAA